MRPWNVLIALLVASSAWAYSTSSNMSLKTPTAGDTDYPTSISDSFSLIDLHDHSSGKGVQIPAGGIAAGACTTAKIADLNVTTGKIAAGAVTRAKLEAVGQQVSSSSSTFNTTSTSYTDVTNLSVSITTTGRPVMLMLIPDGSGTASQIYEAPNTGTPTTEQMFLQYVLDGSGIAEFAIGGQLTDRSLPHFYSAGGFQFLDVSASAGAHVYKLQVKVGGSADGTNPTANVNRVKLVAFEL